MHFKNTRTRLLNVLCYMWRLYLFLFAFVGYYRHQSFPAYPGRTCASPPSTQELLSKLMRDVLFVPLAILSGMAILILDIPKLWRLPF